MTDTAITGIDHSIIGVSDLEQAYMSYEKLGFTITRRGRHEGWGTANYCIMFPEDYIEILGIVDPNQFDAGLVDFLREDGEGLMKIAMRSSDVAITQSYLAKAGFLPSDVQKLGRWLEMPEEDVMPNFRLVHLPSENTPGFKGFMCQHLTPEMVWRDEWLSHPNTAIAAASYIIIHNEPESLQTCYEKFFNKPARLEKEILYVDTGFGEIVFAKQSDLKQLIPNWHADQQKANGAMIAMQIKVTEMSKAEEIFIQNKVSFTQTGSTLFVPETETHGVAIQFIQAQL